VTKAPIVGGTVIVALERQDNTGTDTIFMQAAADSSGNFNFCPLPSGAIFDVVVVAINGAGVAYNATVEAGLPGGTNVGNILLFAETGSLLGPATFQGFVTATTGTSPATPATIDALVSAIQTITLTSGARPVTIPAEGNSVANLNVAAKTSCPVNAPANTNCAQYTLIEPASNPSVATFSTGTITFSTPATGSVPFSIRADAFVPLSGGTTDCTTPSMTKTQDSLGNPLNAVPGPPITPREIDFSGCS
jgi:hypothetical protein